MNSLAPAIILPLTAIAILLLSLFWKGRKFAYALTIIEVIVSIMLVLVLPNTNPVGKFYSNDGLAALFTVFLLSCSLLILLWKKPLKDEEYYYSSFLFALFGVVLALGAKDLLMFFVALEMIAIPSYLLVFFDKTKERMESAVKYFTISAVSSALTLLGIAILFFASGTTSINMISVGQGYSLMGLAAFFSGIAFKLGLFPFNLYLPDVLQGSRQEIAAMISGITKKAAFVILIRALSLFIGLEWALILGLISAFTMTFANLLALAQTNVRRMIFYSIVSHSGFILIGFALASRLGITASIFHMLMHSLMAIGAIFIIGLLLENEIEHLHQFKGIANRNKFLALAFSIFLLSLAGFPFLAGFQSKFLLFSSAMSPGFGWLLAIALINSVISLYYYSRVIMEMYSQEGNFVIFIGMKKKIIIALICTIIILIGVYPGPIINMIDQLMWIN